MARPSRSRHVTRFVRRRSSSSRRGRDGANSKSSRATRARIRRVLQKHDATAPQHRWLVVDGSLGSNSIEQAKVFHQSFGLTGLVVTKLDGTSRGGALVGIYRQLKLPIYFLGLGEKAE